MSKSKSKSIYAALALEGSNASSSVDNVEGGEGGGGEGGGAAAVRANSTNVAVTRMPSGGSSAGSFEEWGQWGNEIKYLAEGKYKWKMRMAGRTRGTEFWYLVSRVDETIEIDRFPHISVFDRGVGNIHLTWGDLSGKKGTKADDFRRGCKSDFYKSGRRSDPRWIKNSKCSQGNSGSSNSFCFAVWNHWWKNVGIPRRYVNTCSTKPATDAKNDLSRQRPRPVVRGKKKSLKKKSKRNSKKRNSKKSSKKRNYKKSAKK